MRCATVRQAANTHVDKRVNIGDGQLLHLFIQFLNQFRPVLQADLEDLSVFNLADSYEVEVGMCKVVSIRQVFDELNIISYGTSCLGGVHTLRCTVKKLHKNSARF